MNKAVLGLAVISTVFAATAPVHAETTDQLTAIVRSRDCPADLREYNDISYKEHCGANYDSALSNMDAVLCQQETDRLNSQIYKYNEFVRQCRQASSRRSQDSRIGNGASSRTTESSAASPNQQQLQQQSIQPRTFSPTDNLVAPGQNKSFDAYSADQWACQKAATGHTQHEFDVSYAQCMVNRGNQSPLATPNVPTTPPKPSTPSSSRSPSSDLSRLIEEQRNKAVGADEQRRQAEQQYQSLNAQTQPLRHQMEQAEYDEAVRNSGDEDAAAFLQGVAGALGRGEGGASSYRSGPARTYQPSYSAPPSAPRPALRYNCTWPACTATR